MAKVASDLPVLDTCFFYGTLQHPGILSRVLQRSIIDLQIVPVAEVPNYSRHHVLHVDYPAIITAQDSVRLTGSTSGDGLAVQGTVAIGLNPADLAKLDAFEGDEYERIIVQASIPTDSRLQAYMYIWVAGLERLSKEIWTYELFNEKKASRWIGADDKTFQTM